MINLSFVEGRFDPSKDSTSRKTKSILPVPSKWHCRVSDMDLETSTWARDVEYKTSQDETRHFQKGKSTEGLLRGWCAAIQQFEPHDKKGLVERLEVWGQPRAWTDELISTWVVEFIANEIGRPSLVYADCLSAQWTSSVLLRAWLENIIWCPYAPDVTSWLQEPDTHEHSQLKALIREVKAELHYALDHEFIRASRTGDHKKLKLPTTWEPFGCWHVVNEAYARFQAKYKDKVPLEGLQANQMLRVRPHY